MMPFGCSMGMTPEENALCAALTQLKTEHGPLVEKMVELQRLATQFVAADAIRKEELLTELQTNANAFIAELEPHSAKEEDVLFTMMAKYVGREAGPIAVMEYEHEQAKRFLNRFLEDGFPDYLQSAVEVLLQHFQKEEQVLFPMAQKLLNEEEKQELLEKIAPKHPERL
ncbi:hemerythrin domain-containing protein [Brevibacillus parabrevis]|jgi:Uncharacterized conserved protein|nr:hemerythrin domain-containing protein [Brevibacillus parabrevis]MED2254441.1 hemerythrin domain-containing protein [Brevibacillus parabrevis]